MITYKIVKIEANQPEKTVELSGQDFDVLLNCMSVYENHLEDSQPSYDDLDDEELTNMQYYTNEVNDFEALDEKMMRFIHGK